MGLRVLARIGQLHPGYAVVLIAAVARPGNAAELAVTVRCELSTAQLQELDARVRLLVHGAPPPPPESVAVYCDGASGSVTLRFADQVRSQPLPSEGEPVERVLEAIEQLLAAEPAPRSSLPDAPESMAPAGGENAPDTPREDTDTDTDPDPDPIVESEARSEDTPPAGGPSRTIGGAGLGVSVERWPDPAGVAVGPRLDFAWGVGSWAVASFESVRFGATPDTRLLAFDALVGVAWGAPFATRGAGALLAIGGEWFSAAASSDPTEQRTSSTFVVDLGLRWGEPLGAATLWLGADGRFRARPPELPEPVEARLGRWSVIVSLGGALTVR